MAVLFRAIVMFVVLVGLPSAWIYYGPLPVGAQQFVDRVVELGVSALAGETTPHQDKRIAAPRYSMDVEPVHFDPQISPASFTARAENFQESGTLQEQLEPHLSVLRKLGAVEYTLEDWGENDQLFRFRCAVSMGADDNFTRQFEAVAADTLAAVRQVVGEVSSWQNARGGNTQWR
ncbi:MAG: hypothetical protein MI725_08380 [Pirellulales bacterium]|nr:hypothetical protein [Pirellulales bacterium]